MAIVFWGSSAWAEGQSPELQASQNNVSQLDTSLSSEPLTKDVSIENSATFDEVTTKELYPPSEDVLDASDPSSNLLGESALAPTQTDFLSIEPSNAPDLADSTLGAMELEPVERSFPADPIAQGISPPPPVEALTSPKPDNRWQFSVEPYLFVPLDVNADVTVAGRTTSLDLGLGDILNLDRAFDAGLRLEAQRDRFGLILDGFYIYGSDSGRLGGTFTGGSLLQFVRRTAPGRVESFAQQFNPQRLQPIIQQLGPERAREIGQIALNTPLRVTADGSVSVRQITVDAAVSYRVVDTSLNLSPEVTNFYPRLTVAPIVGLRTNFLRQTVEVDRVRIDNIPIPEDRIPPIDREFRFSRTFVEPMIGAQVGLGLSDRWSLGLRGDVSGFNIGADRNLTWNLLAGAQYRLSRLASLQLGYHFNSFDFEDGEGLRRARLNLRQNGLWLSAKFEF